MNETEHNMSSEDIRYLHSSSTVKIKPKKRSLVERELETSLTARVTSPATSEGSSTSRYGRARRLKTDSDFYDTDKAVTSALKSPTCDITPLKTASAHKMHALNSPAQTKSPLDVVLGDKLENQIENIYNANISMSRFGSEEMINLSPVKKFSKLYIRRDLVQSREKEKEKTVTLIKNLFSPLQSPYKSTNSHLSNILERSSEKYNININNMSTKQNGFVDLSSVVKTLDFDDSKKRKKENQDNKLVLSKSDLFELEAKCQYQVGDLTWARIGTFPFWPCIITREAGSEMFVKKKMFGRIIRDMIHVTFFGDNGRHSWVVYTMLRPFLGQLEFEETRDKFPTEIKKKDRALFAAFFISDKKQALWNSSVAEAETLLREPKRLRIDIFYDMLIKSRTSKHTTKSQKNNKTIDSDVSLSETLFDTLFWENDGKGEDQERSRIERKKSLDVSDVVTACLDNMAAKTGMTKIQKQSHMDRWLQKAKSKTPEKSQLTVTVIVEEVDEEKETGKAKDKRSKAEDIKEKGKKSRTEDGKKKNKLDKDKIITSKDFPTIKPYSLRKSLNESRTLLSNHCEHNYSIKTIKEINKSLVDLAKVDAAALNGEKIGVNASTGVLENTIHENHNLASLCDDICTETKEEIVPSVVNECINPIDKTIETTNNNSKHCTVATELNISGFEMNVDPRVIEENVIFTKESTNCDQIDIGSFNKLELTDKNGKMMKGAKNYGQKTTDATNVDVNECGLIDNKPLIHDNVTNANVSVSKYVDLKFNTEGTLKGKMPLSEKHTIEETEVSREENLVESKNVNKIMLIDDDMTDCENGSNVSDKILHEEKQVLIPIATVEGAADYKGNQVDEVPRDLQVNIQPSRNGTEEETCVNEFIDDKTDKEFGLDYEATEDNSVYTFVNYEVSEKYKTVVFNTITAQEVSEDKSADTVANPEVSENVNCLDVDITGQNAPDDKSVDTAVNHIVSVKENLVDMKKKLAPDDKTVDTTENNKVADKVNCLDHDITKQETSEDKTLTAVNHKISFKKNCLANDITEQVTSENKIVDTAVYEIPIDLLENIQSNYSSDAKDCNVSKESFADKINNINGFLDDITHIETLDHETIVNRKNFPRAITSEDCVNNEKISDEPTNEYIDEDDFDIETSSINSAMSEISVTENEKLAFKTGLPKPIINEFNEFDYIQKIKSELLQDSDTASINSECDNRTLNKLKRRTSNECPQYNKNTGGVLEKQGSITQNFKLKGCKVFVKKLDISKVVSSGCPLPKIVNLRSIKIDPDTPPEFVGLRASRNKRIFLESSAINVSGCYEGKDSSHSESKIKAEINPINADVNISPELASSRTSRNKRKLRLLKSSPDAIEENGFHEIIDNSLEPKIKDQIDATKGDADASPEFVGRRTSRNRRKLGVLKSPPDYITENGFHAIKGGSTEPKIKYQKDTIISHADTSPEFIGRTSRDKRKLDLPESKDSSAQPKIKDELDPDVISIKSEDLDLEVPLTRRKNRKEKQVINNSKVDKLQDPEFQRYLEIRQDSLIDEHPELSTDEIVAYLYKTWLYEESCKSDIKKTDDMEQSNLVKGLNNNSTQQKRIRKRVKKEKNKIIDLDKVLSMEPKKITDFMKTVPKDKPKRKITPAYYNEDYSDIEDEIEMFEIFKKKPKAEPGLPEVAPTQDSKPMEDSKTPTVLKSGADIKTEPGTDIDMSPGNACVPKTESDELVEPVEVSSEEYYDEVEVYFEQLTQPKPNIFKGLVREKVCEICDKPYILVKCKGCNSMFHVDCVKRENEVIEVPTLVRGRKKKIKKPQVWRPKVSSDSNGVDSESQSDEKSQDPNVSEELNMSLDDECHIVADAENFEAQLEIKMKELLETADNIQYDSYDSDDGLGWSDTEAGICKVVDIKPKVKPINNTDYTDFKCNNCQKYETPICFVCKAAVSPKNHIEHRQRCQVAHCHKYYHLECLEQWPQTQFNSGEPSRSNKKINEHFEAMSCPRHVCHTCVCDDPRGCKTRFSGDKLARCVRCPATYHSFNKCLPAGSKILTASHIICPRHHEHRPGKAPLHVNTGWCFICALGGSLICCEYCPTSFHAECLNISPPEGGYMCEDCETGRLPLYGEMVWVKLGHYRWWPGIVLHPSEIPDNIMAVKHAQGEFVVRFFGQYDHYWVNRGRVFPFQEGDSGRISSQKSKIDEAFTVAMEHAQRAFEILKNVEPNEEESLDIASSLLPPHYVKLKVNKPCGSLCGRRVDVEESSLTQCECNPDEEDPCGPYSHCLNRMLLTECGPSCRAGERCINRAFEKRSYPKMVAYRTPSRGWGLKTLEDIKAGQFVIEYVGELLDEAEFRRRMRRKHEARDENFYFLALDNQRMIDAGPKGNLARFMNHCCEPNCETQKWTVLGDVRVGLFAMRDIPANSEVTFNYNLECTGIEKKRCMCGAKRCSGYIGAKPKQDESQTKKPKLTAKRPYKKRIKTLDESPSTSKCKPKALDESPSTSKSMSKTLDESPSTSKGKPRRGRPPKPRELTEIEKDLLIIKNATNGISSDSESSERLSSADAESEKKDAIILKIKREKISTYIDGVKKEAGDIKVKKENLSTYPEITTKYAPTLKRKRESVSSEDVSARNSPRMKRLKLEDKTSFEVGD